MEFNSVFYTETDSPVGILTLACDSDGKKLTGLWIEGQKLHGNRNSAPPLVRNDDAPIFAIAKDWLKRYFSGSRPSPSPSELSLAPAGTAFQQFVWTALLAIPYGEITTYGAIAKKLTGSVKKSRAVGGAVGRNPISIIIPCHRVVGANGSLVGYAGGLSVKAKLLDGEGIDPYA